MITGRSEEEIKRLNLLIGSIFPIEYREKYNIVEILRQKEIYDMLQCFIKHISQEYIDRALACNTIEELKLAQGGKMAMDDLKYLVETISK